MMDQFSAEEQRVREATNIWEILGLEVPVASLRAADASALDATTVRAAFFRSCKILHPDKVSAQHRAAATIAFQQIVQAYETLSDPSRRDLFLASGEVAAKRDAQHLGRFFATAAASFAKLNIPGGAKQHLTGVAAWLRPACDETAEVRVAALSDGALEAALRTLDDGDGGTAVPLRLVDTALPPPPPLPPAPSSTLRRWIVATAAIRWRRLLPTALLLATLVWWSRRRRRVLRLRLRLL
jgi:hypothetical protein